MYAVMGSTGKVGASVAASLLRHGQRVLLPVRDPERATSLRDQGAVLARADYGRAAELAAAFAEARAGVFVMLPPLFDPSPGFAEARDRIAILHEALRTARPAKIVVLSTIGADARKPNLLSQLQLLEERLVSLATPVTFLRAAWFMDNAAIDVASARERGEIDSYLQPLERPIPMVAAADVGVAAAQLLLEDWPGFRVIQVEGPGAVAPLDLAQALSAALGRSVRATAVPRAAWTAHFHNQGMRNPGPRIQMLDGFNQGWICFSDEIETRRGTTSLDGVIRHLLVSSA